ncbi:MAG: hypothetical protein Q8K78_15150, partial [Planctomycetaceae bacterium]|nr:hypothetical protein [Planctomycetaceae bacterium]
MVIRGDAPRLAWLRQGAYWLLLIAPTIGWANDGRKTSSLLPTSRAAAEDIDEIHYRPLQNVRPGTSAVVTRKAAIEELPLAELTPDARAKAQSVIRGLGLYRRLPTLGFDTDPGVYEFLLKHPVTAVSTWRAMEISRLALRGTGPNAYFADAGDGSIGHVEVWKSTPTETLIYCDGAFKSPLLTKPIIARSIMRLQSRFYKDNLGHPRVEHFGDVFVEFPSQTVETVARVISPLSYSIADRNFKQLSLYVHLMSQAMIRHPEWVQSIARRMDVEEVDKTDFLRVAQLAQTQAEKRAMEIMQPVPVDEILAPLRRSV